MALREYQQSLEVSKLYEIKTLGGVSGRGDMLNPSIWTDALIDIYGSNSATQPASLADMTLDAENTAVSGLLVFAGGVSSIPRYFAMTGSPTEIIASGLEVKELGAIS